MSNNNILILQHKYLSLGYNEIKKINPNVFKCLKEIKEIYLDNNKLKQVRFKWFQKLDCLNVLCLNNNPLVYSVKTVRFLFRFKYYNKSNCQLFVYKSYFL